MNSDKELMSGLIAGDLKSYETLFIACYSKVYRFARQLVKDHWIAEEIAQNVFLKLRLNKTILKAFSKKLLFRYV